MYLANGTEGCDSLCVRVYECVGEGTWRNLGGARKGLQWKVSVCACASVYVPACVRVCPHTRARET